MAYELDLSYRGNICISGLTAAGKTTHSHLLCGEFGCTYISGSQIQLNFLGVSPVQSRDFWITAEAKKLWNEQDFRRIDDELLRLEQTRAPGCVFDTSTMPWRHRKPALCIWLESSLDSRVLKSMVSHHGAGAFDMGEYREKITEKDASTIALYRKLYDIEIGINLDGFDLIIDISELVDEPSLEVSLRSIATTHAIVRSAAGWYLTGSENFRNEFANMCRRHSKLIKRNRLMHEIGG